MRIAGSIVERVVADSHLVLTVGSRVRNFRHGGEEVEQMAVAVVAV